jgi:RNA polymerase sigma-70 factor (ECF subfamily)
MAEPGDPDVQLMLRVKARDREAMASLYARYATPLFRFLLHLMGRREPAEDVLQETFLRVWRAGPAYEPSAAVSTWLFTVARNAALNALARQRGRALTDAEAEGAVAPEAEEGGGEREAVRAAVDRLPAGERAVVILSVYGGLRYAEIARALGIPAGTVKSRMAAAVARLRRRVAAAE